MRAEKSADRRTDRQMAFRLYIVEIYIVEKIIYEHAYIMCVCGACGQICFGMHSDYEICNILCYM